MKPMNREHPQYEEFQFATNNIHEDRKIPTRPAEDADSGVRSRAAWIIGDIGHLDGLPHLTAEGQGINDEYYWVRARAAEAIGKIAEATKQEQPEHPAVIAMQHINPEEHLKAFIKLYKALERGEHKKQPKEWLTTYAKQLKALEGDLK